MFQIQNNSVEDVNPIIDILNQFMPFSQKKLGFHKPVSLFLQSDEENANKILGKTAFYNPAEFSVTVFTTGRHPKDILRSLSHELVHHAQNCRGDFEGDHIASEGYAQKDPHMRNMELEAYEKGNIIFRDFEDLIKAGKINIKLSGEPKMSLKEWKDNELNTLLMEKWGYRKEDDKAKEDEGADEEGNRPSMAKDMDLDESDVSPKARAADDAATAGHDRRRQARHKQSGKPAKWYHGEAGKKSVAPGWPPGQKSVKEACPDLEGDEIEIDIIGPEMGMEAEASDLSDLTPDEAFGAGWAAAAQAIEDALATGPEEAVEAGEEMGEEEEEELMEQYSDEQGLGAGFPKGMKSTSPEDVAKSSAELAARSRAPGEDPLALAQQAIGMRLAAATTRRGSTAKQKKMAPGETGAAAVPGTEPGDLYKETIDLAEAKKAAKQVFIKLLKEKRMVNEDSVNPPGATIVPGGTGRDGLPHEGTWARKQFTAGRQWKFTPEEVDNMAQFNPSPDPPETKRQKKKRYNKPPRKTGSGSRQIDRAREVGINESLSIEEAKKIAKNIFIRFLKEEEALSGNNLDEIIDTTDSDDAGTSTVAKSPPDVKDQESAASDISAISDAPPSTDSAEEARFEDVPSGPTIVVPDDPWKVKTKKAPAKTKKPPRPPRKGGVGIAGQ